MDEDVKNLLIAWGLSSYLDVFAENHITINCLVLLDSHMIKELIPSIGHRINFIEKLNNWKMLDSENESNLSQECQDSSLDEEDYALPGSSKLADCNALPGTSVSSKLADCNALPATSGSSKIADCNTFPGTSRSSTLNDAESQNLTDDPDYVDILSNKHRQPLIAFDNFEIQQCENINTPVYNTYTPILLSTKTDDTRSSKKTLLEILKDKPEGKMLLKLYQNEGVLDNNARKKLCNIITKELLGNEPNEAKVTNETILDMARQIKDIFKKENISTYFIPYVHNKKLKIKRCAKGKLYDCLNNRRREYRAAEKKIICTHNKELEIAVDDTSSIDTENIHKDLEWLRKSSEPWKIVEEKWKNTCKIRIEESKNITVSDYMNEYPVLKKPTGYQLLLIDFETLYPEKSQRLYETFVLYRNKILDLAQIKANKNAENPINKLLTEYEALKETSDNTSEEGSNIVALMMLPLLLSSPLLKSKKSSWRPSKQESMEGFITHVPREMDVQETINKRKEKFFKIGVTFQPTIFIVGPSVTDIKKYFVLVNNIFYTVHSILQAVDVCFKLYLALNCTYPIECENVWNLIQKGFYNIKTEWDKQYSSVNAFLTDLGISE